MNEERINIVQEILTSWNPLGDRANSIPGLNNYEVEATDILFHTNRHNSVGKVTTLTKDVLNQAFNVQITREEAKPYAKQIYQAIKEKENQ